jgi:hypothetical protein
MWLGRSVISKHLISGPEYGIIIVLSRTAAEVAVFLCPKSGEHARMFQDEGQILDDA